MIVLVALGGTIKSNASPSKGNLYKLYINPGPEIAKLVIPFMQKCNEASLPAELKIMDPHEVTAETRSDVVNIYTTSPENIKKICEVLTQVVEENNIQLRRKTKEFSVSLDENNTIGLGYDHVQLNRSWSGYMEQVLAKQIREYFEANGNLTSDEIKRIKEESSEKYADFCKELYKILNEKCLYQAKKIVGLQGIMTDKTSKSTDRNSENIIPSILNDGKVQINGLTVNMKYNPIRKGYIVEYDDGKAFYTTETILEAFDRGEIIYSREEIKKNDSVWSINQKQHQRSETVEEMKLPEGAEWKLSSSGKHMLVIMGENGSKMSYSAEVASKKFGVKVPEQYQETNPLPEGAEWKLNSSGKYMLVIIGENGSKMSYSLDVAIKKFGVTPPNYKSQQVKSELPIARNTKKCAENIAATEVSRDVQKTATEIKEEYKGYEKPMKGVEK